MLFVFLPGRGDSMTVFQKEGIIESIRKSGLPADMVAVNMHLGYYLGGLFFPRMKEDVIDPAKAAGYKQIWIVGDSLGGFGSLSYAREYPNDVTGAVLLGPFPGEVWLINEIKRSGGIHKWDPEKIDFNTEEGQVKLNLMWLKEHGRGQRDVQKAHPVPVIYLGYGREDRFTYGQDILASLLPSDRVLVIEGGHDWSTWKKIWNTFLEKHIFESKERAESNP